MTKERQKYRILVINAASICRRGSAGAYSMKRDAWRLEYTIESRGGCAMYDQLAMCLGQTDPDRPGRNEDVLLRRLIYVECKELIQSKEGKDALESLIRDGFSLTWDRASDVGKESIVLPETVHYAAFDKSSSMSRKCIMTFLDESCRDEMEERLMLGMDFPGRGIELELSKYYSYRGLYLSTAQRVSGLHPDGKSVIVLPDDEHLLPPEKLLVAEAKEEPSGIIIEGTLKDSQSAKKQYEFRVLDPASGSKKDRIRCCLPSNAFDGEGLISPDYARIIKDEIDEPDASSFQIRMPFGKGVLHTVDFAAMIQEALKRAGEDSVGFDELWILDAFQRPRRLKDAGIILTESMLKCGKWLSAYYGDDIDPMEEYFEAFRKYGHSLYICRTDDGLEKGDVTGMNYQFFGTLDLTEEELRGLAMDELEKTEDFLRGGEELTKYLALTDKAKDPSWRNALAKNRAFLGDDYVRTQVELAARSRRIGVICGEIRVPGQLRFLSGDLMALMRHLADSLILSNKKENAACVRGSFNDAF